MVFPSINLLFWSVLTPHVSVIIESMLNQAWSPGYLSIFLSKHFPLWPVSGPQFVFTKVITCLVIVQYDETCTLHSLPCMSYLSLLLAAVLLLHNSQLSK